MQFNLKYLQDRMFDCTSLWYFLIGARSKNLRVFAPPWCVGLPEMGGRMVIKIEVCFHY